MVKWQTGRTPAAFSILKRQASLPEWMNFLPVLSRVTACLISYLLQTHKHISASGTELEEQEMDFYK